MGLRPGAWGAAGWPGLMSCGPSRGEKGIAGGLAVEPASWPEKSNLPRGEAKGKMLNECVARSWRLAEEQRAERLVSGQSLEHIFRSRGRPEGGRKAKYAPVKNG